MRTQNLARLKPNERQAVEAFVEALRREMDGQALLLVLFGSKARGDDTPDSDIDFLMVTEGDPREIGRRVIELQSELEIEHNVLLNTLSFSRERWADFARRQAAFWQNAQRDGMLLLRSPHLPDSLVTPQAKEKCQMSDHRPEITGYVERAREALRDAESDMERDQYHDVANRAYYAIFYAANAMLATQGLQRSKHSGVKALFLERFVKTGQIEPAYSADYREAMERREVSDYDWSSPVDEAYVRVGLEAAQRFVRRIERYLSEHGFLAE